MEDICYSYLRYHRCAANEGAPCPLAHGFTQLQNLDHWVSFDLPHNSSEDDLVENQNIQILDFIAYKYCAHPSFKWYAFPTGPVVRFASAQDAQENVTEFYATNYGAQMLSVDHPFEAKKLSGAALSLAVKTIPSHGEEKADFGNVAVPPVSPSYASTTSTTMSPLLLHRNEKSRKTTFDVLESLSSCCGLSEGESSGLHPHESHSSLDEAFPSPVTDPTSAPSSPTTQVLAEEPNAESLRGSGSLEVGSRSLRHAYTCSFTDMVLQLLRDNAQLGPEQLNQSGWQALEQIWDVRPETLDTNVIHHLQTKPADEQEQILLSFAALNLMNIGNLSAYLNSYIKQYDCTTQVCMYFLAGVCPHASSHEGFVHPFDTPGWNALYERWNLTYLDFDHMVLNYLSKKPLQQQNDILFAFAEINLSNVVNLSAYLSCQIQSFERSEAYRQSLSKYRRHGQPHNLTSSRPKRAETFHTAPIMVSAPTKLMQDLMRTQQQQHFQHQQSLLQGVIIAAGQSP